MQEKHKKKEAYITDYVEIAVFHRNYYFLQIFMGMMAIQVYAKELFGKAAPNLPSHLCSVLLALVLVASCIVSAVVTDKAGRRVSIDLQ